MTRSCRIATQRRRFAAVMSAAVDGTMELTSRIANTVVFSSVVNVNSVRYIINTLNSRPRKGCASVFSGSSWSRSAPLIDAVREDVELKDCVSMRALPLISE